MKMFDLITIFVFFYEALFALGLAVLCLFVFCYFLQSMSKCGCIMGLVGYGCRMIVRYSVCNAQVQREKELMSSTQVTMDTLSPSCLILNSHSWSHLSVRYSIHSM